jgi:hypothetical protein
VNEKLGELSFGFPELVDLFILIYFLDSSNFYWKENIVFGIEIFNK